MRPQVIECVRDLVGVTGNASSIHAEGRAARARIEAARADVAALAGVSPAQVTFTSGASEANVTALSPVWRKGRGELRFSRLLVAASEHASVLSGGRFARECVETLKVDGDGLVELAGLEARLAQLSAEGETVLVSVMAANNETGVLQPLAEIGRLVADAGAVLHVDAVQIAGRRFIDMEAWQAASLSLSAHKIGGPQGVGALVTRQPGLKPVPLLTGGGQEHWDRAGTENVAAIAGFGVAAALAATELGTFAKIEPLRDGLEQEVRHISGNLRLCLFERQGRCFACPDGNGRGRGTCPLRASRQPRSHDDAGRDR
jgi:cysteine desulfurase